MITDETVLKKVLGFVGKLKEETGLEIEVSEKTVIIGSGSQFDSMTFLDLVGMIEEWIDEEFDLFVSVASDDDDFEPDGPFGNVRRLSDHLTVLINTGLAG